MSGGYFDYQQYRINDITTEIQEVIEKNEYSFTEQTLQEFKTAVELLNKASIYTHRIDWLLSGDDGEERFHDRLRKDLGLKYQLHKISCPGWTKNYGTEEEVRQALYGEMCSICRKGIFVEDNGINIQPVTENSTLNELLLSQCGCEYAVDEFEEG